ncbi:MAG: class I SAM-dependent methyltransferase [Nitrospiraceae bacterium]|nr:class I SAM-dependent methyltransferase [Nitrospiraceae bacterium]
MTNYYEKIGQAEDRIGLRFFANIVQKRFKTGRILDFGCGTGYFLKRFSKPGYQLIGYDLSLSALEHAKRINPQAMFIADPNRDIDDESIDCICALHVLEHIKEPSHTIGLFLRKLKRHGLLFIVVPNSRSLGKRIKGEHWFAYGDPTHCSLFAPRIWTEIITSHGFDLEKIGTDGLWNVPYLKFVPLALQKLIFYPTAAFQYWFNVLFLPLPLGENLILVCRKRDIREPIPVSAQEPDHD